MFAELVKFEHSIFALPYAYIGALYAAASMQPLVTDASGGLTLPANAWVTVDGWPTLSALVWITVAMVGARAFAFVVNRAVDKEIDARNPRTAGRAVPAGLVKAWELWLFAAVMLAVYLLRVWQLAPDHPMALADPARGVPHLPLHEALHVAVPLLAGPVPRTRAGGGVGSRHRRPAGTRQPWVLGVAVLFWTAGFDIIYATQDVECDLRDGVHSVPADFGVSRRSHLRRASAHVLTVVLLVASADSCRRGWPWYAGVALAAGTAGLRERDRLGR